MIEPKIIFEDTAMLAVAKPAGMVVNKARTTKGMVTLQDWLSDKGINRQVERNGIVHRLDKETSGVIVVAKSELAMAKLQWQFKNRTTVKQYITLVHGKLESREGSVQAPISRNPFNRTRFGVFVGGRQAETRYMVTDYLLNQKTNEQLSLLTVNILTGRTHQIRVHMQHLKHPVVGDLVYAGRKTAKKDRQWCPRLFLHAYQLVVRSPEDGKEKRLMAELPDDLKKVVKGLKRLQVTVV